MKGTTRERYSRPDVTMTTPPTPTDLCRFAILAQHPRPDHGTGELD